MTRPIWVTVTLAVVCAHLKYRGRSRAGLAVTFDHRSDAAANVTEAIKNIGVEIIFPSESLAFNDGKARQA